MLCFITAFGSLAGAGWSLFARSETADSLSEVSEYLTADAQSAIGELITLNTVLAVLNAVFAVALVVGGVMLLRRKPAARVVVAAISAVYLLATIASYLVSAQVWSGIVTAMGDVPDVDVMRIGPGLGSAVRGVVGALVVLGLVLAPSTKRWLANEGQWVSSASLAHDPSAPPPSGATAIIAAVWSLIAGVVVLVLLGMGVYGAFDPNEKPQAQVLSAVIAGLCVPFAAGFITGGILLLKRRFAGAITITVTWAALIMGSFGLLFTVLGNERRPPEALGIMIAVVAAAVVLGAVPITLAMLASTRRWCRSRTGSTGPVPIGG